MNSRRAPNSQLEVLRVPPQSVEAEQAVLGGLMLSPDSLAIVADILREEHFYRHDHRLLYRAIKTLDEKRKPFDAVTMGEWFEANGLSEQIGGTSYLIALASSTPSAANIKAYAEIVFEKALCRELIQVGTAVVNDGFQPEGREADLMISEAQRRLSDLGRHQLRGGPEHIKPGLKQMFATLRERWESGVVMTGVPTPWADLNIQTNGLQDGDLIVLAGRPSMGKTIGGEQLAAHAAEHAGPTAIFSVEMSTPQLLQRMTSRVGKVPHEYLRSPGRFADDPDEDGWWAGINEAMRKLSQLPLHIDQTRGITIDQLVARARRLHLKEKLRLVMIDHLHIIPIKGDNPVRERGEVSRQLKALAGELGCPVVVLAQLNRANNSRPDKRPTLADLRESGEIEQNADDVWFLHREDYYHRDTHMKGVVELIVAKARNAPAGTIINLRNRYDQMRLEDWIGPLPEAQERIEKATNARRSKWSDPRSRQVGD